MEARAESAENLDLEIRPGRFVLDEFGSHSCRRGWRPVDIPKVDVSGSASIAGEYVTTMLRKRIDRAARARDKRRKQLLDAATRVFAQKGYWSASITDIIRSAGVARGTFYLYFRSKRDVFLAIANNWRDGQKRFTRQSGPGQPPLTPEISRARIRADFLEWLEFYRQNIDAATIVLRDASTVDPLAARKRGELRQAFRSDLAKNVARLQEAGIYHRNVTPEMAAHFLVGMFDEIAATCLQGARTEDLPQLADQYVEFAFHGLSAQ
jgi:AcrR family transcriptional regulator